MTEREQIEFRRPFAIADLGDGEARLAIEAGSHECERLARRFELVSIGSLAASLSLKLNPAGEIDVRGQLAAEVVQTCVVSLKPAPARLAEDFSVRYAPGAREPIEDLSYGPCDEEPPEPLTGDTIDLGELVAQQLALALDPFPRARGVQLDEPPKAEVTAAGPFAGLAALKRRRQGGA